MSEKEMHEQCSGGCWWLLLGWIAFHCIEKKMNQFPEKSHLAGRNKMIDKLSGETKWAAWNNIFLGLLWFDRWPDSEEVCSLVIYLSTHRLYVLAYFVYRLVQMDIIYWYGDVMWWLTSNEPTSKAITYFRNYYFPHSQWIFRSGA